MFKDIIGKLFKKKITVYYKKLRPEAKAPYKKHEDDSCWDLYAATCNHVFGTKDKDGNMIPDYYEYGTGLAFAVPKGYEMECRPRSSIFTTGLVLSNSPGTVDCGHTGEVKAFFYSIKNGTPYEVGDRIFQVRINPARYDEFEFVEVDELPNYGTTRGDNGFGSTGRK